MALISCPECGKEVSDQALACIHCGYPLQSFPPPKRAPRQYSLVFTGLGPHADIPAALHCLSKELGLSQKDAQALLERAPAVLVAHLKPREAQRLVQVLAGYGISSKIVVGEEVSSPINQALRYPCRKSHRKFCPAARGVGHGQVCMMQPGQFLGYA